MNNSIFDRYNELLRTSPNRVIAIKGNEHFTISEIDTYANVIASKVREYFSEYEHIPVYSTDDFFYLICMLGIWKSGKVYVPIQVDFPKKRLDYVLGTLGVPIILTRSSDAPPCGKRIEVDFSHCNAILDNDISFTYPNGDAIAYMLMTSGSTGMPKCVCIKHENLNWFLETMQKLICFGSADRFLVSTPVSFDVSFHEILSWIYGEGTIVFVEGKNDIEKFKKIKTLLYDMKVSHIAMSPSAFRSLTILLHHSLEHTFLEHVILAGEELQPSVIAPYVGNTNVRFYNFYGPTETTIYATGYEVKKTDGNKVPIGKPLPGASIILLNENLEEMEDYGEIAISGMGVSMGYYQDSDLNAQQFKFINGKKYYLTGDYAFYENDELIFDCRKDNQIEVNGIRVELGEIDAAIADIIGCNCSKTIYVDNKIITFLEQGNNTTTSRLEYELQKYLPKYMLPQKLMEINNIPLNTNRKTDVRALEKRAHQSFAVKQNDLHELRNDNLWMPQNNYLSLFNQLLDMPVADTTDLIADRAIDSLQQIEIIACLEEMFYTTIDYNIIQTYRTPKAIWEALQEQNGSPLNVDIMGYIADNIFSHAAQLKKESYRVYDTYYIQKCYAEDHFSQVLHDMVPIPADIPKDILEERLIKYMDANSVLTSYLVKREKGALMFAIPNCFAAHLREYKSDVDKTLVELTCELLEKEYAEMMFYCFLNHGRCGRYLHIFLNHNICDQSSLNIITQELNDLFWRNKIKEKATTYFDFIRYQNQNVVEGSNENLQKIYRMGFAGVKEEGLKGGPHINYISYKYESEKKEDMIMEMNYLIMQILMESQNLKVISAGTLFDIRRFANLDITDVIGDIHTTLPLFSVRGEDKKAFLSRNQQIYDMAYNGFNWNNALYKEYPYVRDEYKKYEHFIDDNQKLSTNFIGRKKGDSPADIVASIKEANAILKQFSFSKLYITSFLYKDEMICVFLNDVFVSEDAVNKYNCKLVR